LSKHSSFDVAVVGGGAVGLAVGWRAAQQGLRVAILERHQPGHGTSWVAAGMLAPVTEVTLVERHLLKLGLAAAERYPSFAEELGAASGIDSGYSDCGTLLLARDGDEAQALEREFELRRQLGLRVERLLPSQARRREPALAPTVRLAVEVKGDHAIDPRQLTQALVGAIASAGGELRTEAPVERVQGAQDGVVTGVKLASGEVIGAEHVVIAAGPWSGGLSGIPEAAMIPLRPVKGQLLRLHDPAGPGLLTHVLRMSTGYLVPRGDGRYVLGATMEERGFDTTVTAGAAFELLRDATELVPALAELIIDELLAGLRPATPDNAPAIGPGAVPGLHWAVGHYRNGILLAPVTADIVLAGLAGEESGELGAAVSPSRFTGVPVGA
jgi:glycine oxidase